MKILTKPMDNVLIYMDLFFILACLFTILLQLDQDPQEILPKVVMIVQVALAMIKTMRSLKIINIYSPLITMVTKVIWGLRFFLFLFFSNVVIFTQLIKILEIDLPEKPYRHIGWQIGYTNEGFLLSMRKKTVIGSFKHDVEEADLAKTITFWIVWIIIIFTQAIIFLKFIKAEAKAIYKSVKKRLRETVMKDKCKMISEAE